MKPFHRNPFGRFCRFLIVLCCLGVFLPACSSQGSGGLFSYAVDSSGSTLSPKTVKFNMTPEEVRSAAQIPGTDLDTTLGEDHPRIIRSIEIPWLSDTVQEIFSFQDNRLVAVEYAVTVPESAFEKPLQPSRTKPQQRCRRICCWAKTAFPKGKPPSGRMPNPTPSPCPSPKPTPESASSSWVSTWQKTDTPKQPGRSIRLGCFIEKASSPHPPQVPSAADGEGGCFLGNRQPERAPNRPLP